MRRKPDYREPAETVRENRARRWAHRLEYVLHRSRAKKLHMNNKGLYQLVNYNNGVVMGADFDATLRDVEIDLAKQEQALAR